MAELSTKEINFACLTYGIDTGTDAGPFFFHALAAMAEMEPDLVRERTLAGLAPAKACGRLGGRPTKLTAQQVSHAKLLLAHLGLSAVDFGNAPIADFGRAARLWTF